MSTPSRVINRYSEAFKHKVVGEIEQGEISISRAMEIYDIKGCETIQNWMRRLGKHHLLNKVVRIEMKDEADKLKALKKEKAELESALAKAQLKILRLESIIEAAEEDLRIDLKKSIEKKDSKKQLPEEKKNNQLQ